MSNLYSQEIWDKGYEKLTFEVASEKDQVRRWLEKWANNRTGKCFEVGCFPGRYLAVMGKLGLELNGIDLTPRVDIEMDAWLRQSGFSVGKIIRGDFLKADLTEKYDVVYSLGFIEHFTNWSELLQKHLFLVKEGGLLMLLVPNFVGGFQRAFHKLLDRENFDRHTLAAMDVEEWRKQVEAGGFRVLDAGYYDELDYWVGEQKRTFLQRSIFLGLRAVKPILRLVVPRGSRTFAPYVVMVAIKEK